jgi:hypothetical protein
MLLGAQRTDNQSLLARDIFGNPFRRVVRDPALLTSAVTSLARAAYEERSN